MRVISITVEGHLSEKCHKKIKQDLKQNLAAHHKLCRLT